MINVSAGKFLSSRSISGCLYLKMVYVPLLCVLRVDIDAMNRINNKKVTQFSVNQFRPREKRERRKISFSSKSKMMGNLLKNSLTRCLVNDYSAMYVLSHVVCICFGVVT